MKEDKTPRSQPAITTSWKDVAWRRIVLILVISTVAFIAIVNLLKWSNWSLFEAETVDHTSNWAQYNKNTFSQLFKLPEDAEITSATESSGIFSQLQEVQFRLPDDKSPEEWLYSIAEDASLIKYRINKHDYDAGFLASKDLGLSKRSDTCRLSYDTDTELYTASWGWD